LAKQAQANRKMTMVPTECRMPPLYSELQRLQPRLILVVAFVGNGTLSPGAAAIRRNLVRLVDKAIHEYSLAREAVLNQINEAQRSPEEMRGGRVLYMFGFTDHMENCLNAMRRVLGLLQHLRSDMSAPPQDRLARRLIEAHTGSLIDVRNTFEHFGSAINNNEIGDGQMVVLSYSDDQNGVCIGNHALSFDSIAKILRALHAEATTLLEAPHQERAG
jgi:hypothetical protein